MASVSPLTSSPPSPSHLLIPSHNHTHHRPLSSSSPSYSNGGHHAIIIKLPLRHLTAISSTTPSSPPFFFYPQQHEQPPSPLPSTQPQYTNATPRDSTTIVHATPQHHHHAKTNSSDRRHNHGLTSSSPLQHSIAAPSFPSSKLTTISHLPSSPSSFATSTKQQPTNSSHSQHPRYLRLPCQNSSPISPFHRHSTPSLARPYRRKGKRKKRRRT